MYFDNEKNKEHKICYSYIQKSIPTLRNHISENNAIELQFFSCIMFLGTFQICPINNVYSIDSKIVFVNLAGYVNSEGIINKVNGIVTNKSIVQSREKCFPYYKSEQM